MGVLSCFCACCFRNLRFQLHWVLWDRRVHVNKSEQSANSRTGIHHFVAWDTPTNTNTILPLGSQYIYLQIFSSWMEKGVLIHWISCLRNINCYETFPLCPREQKGKERRGDRRFVQNPLGFCAENLTVCTESLYSVNIFLYKTNFWYFSSERMKNA